MKQAIYVIAELDGDGFVKIGRAVDPSKRLNELQIGNPRQLRLSSSFVPKDAVATERQIHKWLKDSRVRGEWFDIPPLAAQSVVERACSKGFTSKPKRRKAAK